MDPGCLLKLNDPINYLEYLDYTKVRYFDNRNADSKDEHLDEDGLKGKLEDIKAATDHNAPLVELVTGQDAQPKTFIMINTIGSGHELDPYQISKDMFVSLVSAGALSEPFLCRMANLLPHFSYHVQFSEDHTTPVALCVFVRMDRTVTFDLSLRIRLRDHSCVVLFSSRDENTIEELRDRTIRQMELIQKHPMHFLNLIAEALTFRVNDFIDSRFFHVAKLEKSIGVASRTSYNPVDNLKEDLEKDNFPKLLQLSQDEAISLAIHSANIKFLKTMLEQLKDTVKAFEDLSAEVGGLAIEREYRTQLTDQIRSNEVALQCVEAECVQLESRVQSQISVIYSLIAQHDNNQNITIARGSHAIATITARDSRTMKTITVLTLLFLPATMLASLWDAQIVIDQSWRVYVVTTVVLTTVVFCTWYAYVWIDTREQRRQTAEEEKGEKQA